MIVTVISRSRRFDCVTMEFRWVWLLTVYEVMFVNGFIGELPVTKIDIQLLKLCDIYDQCDSSR